MFGKVGGFAIQTLGKNYDILSKNLATANAEMETGLSLIIETGVQSRTTASQWTELTNSVKEWTLAEKGFVGDFVAGLRTIWETGSMGLMAHLKMKKIFEEEKEALIGMAQAAGKTDEEINAMINDIMAQGRLTTGLDQIRRYALMLDDLTDVDSSGAVAALDVFTTFSKALQEYSEARDDLNNSEGESVENYIDMADALDIVKDKIISSFGEDVLSQIEAYYNSQKKVEESTQTLSDLTWEYKLRIKELQRELKDVGDSLAGVRDEINDVNSSISNILNRRFTIRGVSETNITHMVRQQELELEKAKFATLGLGTAEDFLRNASVLTADALNQQTDAMRKLNDATASGQDRYEAWRTALTETIRALVLSSQDLDKDVTGVVQKAQTELLGITQMESGGGDQFSTMETNLESLRSAQNIFFGEEREKLDYSERQREDRVNGVNRSADEAINALDSQRNALDELMAEESNWIAMQEELQAEIDATREKIDELTEAYYRQKDAISSGSEPGTVEGAGESLGIGSGRYAGIQSPDVLNAVKMYEDVRDRQPSGGTTIGDVAITVNGSPGMGTNELAIDVARQLNSLAGL